MQLQYLDGYLIHWPATGVPAREITPPVRETWTVMEALASSGRVRSIGVSNFSIKKLKDLLTWCNIRPAVNQASRIRAGATAADLRPRIAEMSLSCCNFQSWNIALSNAQRQWPCNNDHRNTFQRWSLLLSRFRSTPNRTKCIEFEFELNCRWRSTPTSATMRCCPSAALRAST